MKPARRPKLVARLEKWLATAKPGRRAAWDLGVSMVDELEQLAAKTPAAAAFVIDALEVAVNVATLQGLRAPGGAPTPQLKGSDREPLRLSRPRTRLPHR